MKHPVKNILILFTALCLITAYKDLKAGFAEGFQQENEQSVKESEPYENNNSRFHDFTLPLIIKTY